MDGAKEMTKYKLEIRKENIKGGFNTINMPFPADHEIILEDNTLCMHIDDAKKVFNGEGFNDACRLLIERSVTESDSK